MGAKSNADQQLQNSMSAKQNHFKLLLAALGSSSVVLACAISAVAGSVTYNFNTDPTSGANAIRVYQEGGFVNSLGENVYWRPEGGNTGGFLGITWPIGGSSTIAVFPDIDGGKIVTSFRFECDLRVGNPQQQERAADGFSINFARTTDPVFVNDPPSSGNFATSGAVETGTRTGIAISFDTWSGNTLPDSADIEGIIVRVDNRTILRQAMPTRNGACDDNTSLQTGPRSAAYWTAERGNLPDSAYVPGAWSTLCWQPLIVELDEQSRLTVIWKGRTVLDKRQTDYFPSAGGLILAGRTGGADQHTHFDNIRLTTTAIATDNQPPTTPANLRVSEAGAYRIALAWDPSTDDSGRVGYDIEQNGTLLPGQAVQPTADIRGLSPTTTYNFRVRATDVANNKSPWVSVQATTVADVTDTNFAAIKIYGSAESPIPGASTGDLEAMVWDPRYPNNPDRIARLNGMIMSFGEPAFGDTFGDNIGFRLAGTVTPGETGGYRFFIRSDDASQLYLNTSGPAIPEADLFSFIAQETGCCAAFLEPDTAQSAWRGQTSEVIQLQAGRSYGILFIVKEGGGGDWGQVAWRKEGDTTAPSALAPIGYPFFVSEASPKADPVGAVIEIVQQPISSTAMEGQSVTNSVVANVSSPYVDAPYYQWFKNGNPISGANSASYRFTVTAADNNAKYKVRIVVPGKAVESQEATLTVVSDTVPPVPMAGALPSSTGNTVDVGVGFDEPVEDASAGVQANYSISKGTIQTFTYYSKSKSALLKVAGLSPGETATVTVRNVADTKGNRITSADATFTVSGKLKWGVVGGNEQGAGNYVVPVADNGFDIYSDGVAEWGTYDEATFVYEEITGDFDKKLRVEYQDASSQWARAGLIVRDVTNFGVDRFAQEGGAAGRYQKVHVNPVGPTLTGPGNPGNGAWEGNRRIATGAATTTAGGGGIPQYPNAWCRLQRTGDVFTIYRSDDGATWTQLGTTTWEGATPAKLFVGPEYSPENGNITDPSSRGVWLAKIRDYGDTFGAEPPSISAVRTATGITITFTGSLESADVVTGPWTAVSGTSPLNVQTTGPGKFYRSKQ
jgi:hypothetical protein